MLEQLFNQLAEMKKIPTAIVTLWGVTGKNSSTDPAHYDATQANQALETGFYPLLYLVQALGAQDMVAPVSIYVVTNDMQQVIGTETLDPGKAPVLGLCKTIPQEHPHIRCRSIDITLPVTPTGTGQSGQTMHNPAELRELAQQLTAEFMSAGPEPAVAYRSGPGWIRWVQSFEPVRLERQPGPSPVLKQQGVYLITGGLGRIGLSLAEALAREVNARLVLVSRTQLPPREQWDHCLTESNTNETVSRRIRRLRRVEALGGRVWYSAPTLPIMSACSR